MGNPKDMTKWLMLSRTVSLWPISNPRSRAKDISYYRSNFEFILQHLTKSDTRFLFYPILEYLRKKRTDNPTKIPNPWVIGCESGVERLDLIRCQWQCFLSTTAEGPQCRWSNCLFDPKSLRYPYFRPKTSIDLQKLILSRVLPRK